MDTLIIISIYGQFGKFRLSIVAALHLTATVLMHRLNWSYIKNYLTNQIFVLGLDHPFSQAGLVQLRVGSSCSSHEEPGIKVYWDPFLEVELDLRNISPHKTFGQLSHQAADVVLPRPFAVGTHSIQMGNDVPMTFLSHAGVGSSIFPVGALHHVSQPLSPVGLAPGAGFLFLRDPVLLEEVVGAHRGLLSVETVVLICEAGLHQG